MCGLAALVARDKRRSHAIACTVPPKCTVQHQQWSTRYLSRIAIFSYPTLSVPVLSRYRGIQLATEMLPLKVRVVAHSFNCTPILRICVMLTHLFCIYLENHLFLSKTKSLLQLYAIFCCVNFRNIQHSHTVWHTPTQSHGHCLLRQLRHQSRHLYPADWTIATPYYTVYQRN